MVSVGLFRGTEDGSKASLNSLVESSHCPLVPTLNPITPQQSRVLRHMYYAWSLSRVQVFVTPWTVACQSPLFMGFSRQEYWSGLPFYSPGYLPNPGIDPGSPELKADFLPLSHWGSPGQPHIKLTAALPAEPLTRPSVSAEPSAIPLSRKELKELGVSQLSWTG